MNKPIYIFSNWKMYLNLQESIDMAELYKESTKNLDNSFEICAFPSALAYDKVKNVLQDSKIKVGAQNTYWIDKGGYTGEVSAQMYAEDCCQYVLVGHSERRHQFGETNEDTNKKMESVLKNNIIPVLCVGETSKEREDQLTKDIIDEQLRSAFNNIDWPEKMEVIIAYEPVWAIGTGVTPSLIDIDEIQQEIKKLTKDITGQEPILLYGGSVRSENIKEFLDDPLVDGVLIGGASAKNDGWLEIIKQIEV